VVFHAKTGGVARPRACPSPVHAAAKIGSFLLQVADFLTVRLLDKHQAFRVLTQILNFAPHKLEHARLKHDTFLDYYVAASHLECHRGHLRVDNYYVKSSR